MFEVGKTYKDRSGLEVTLVHDYGEDCLADMRLLWVKYGEPGEEFHTNTDGFYIDGELSDGDVLPPRQTVWLNVYEGQAQMWCHKTRESADATRDNDCTQCIPVELPEGVRID